MKEKKKKGNQDILIRSLLMLIFLGTILVANNTNKNIKEKTIEVFDESKEKDSIKTQVQKQDKEISSQVTDWNLILVNQENRISEDYTFILKEIENGNKIDERIEQTTKDMLDAARKQGLKPYICIPKDQWKGRQHRPKSVWISFLSIGRKRISYILK